MQYNCSSSHLLSPSLYVNPKAQILSPFPLTPSQPTLSPSPDILSKPKRQPKREILPTYQKCTVFNPIGLSHILLNQLTCAAVAAAASVLWNLLVCFPAKRDRANAFLNVEYWRADEEFEVKNRDAAEVLLEEVEVVNLLIEVGLKRKARARVEGDILVGCLLGF